MRSMASMAIATSYLQLNSSVLKAMTMANKVAYIKVAKACTSSQTAQLHRNWQQEQQEGTNQRMRGRPTCSLKSFAYKIHKTPPFKILSKSRKNCAPAHGDYDKLNMGMMAGSPILSSNGICSTCSASMWYDIFNTTQYFDSTTLHIFWLRLTFSRIQNSLVIHPCA